MVPIKSLSVMISCRRRLGVTERDAVRTVVSLGGEHDASTVATLSTAMARAIMLDDNDVVVDLSGVEFMGAATVGVMVRARGVLEAQERRLLLRSPSRCARRVLELCGDTDLLASAGATPVAGHGARVGIPVVPTADRDDRPVDASPSTSAGALTRSKPAHAQPRKVISAVAALGVVRRPHPGGWRRTAPVEP